MSSLEKKALISVLAATLLGVTAESSCAPLARAEDSPEKSPTPIPETSSRKLKSNAKGRLPREKEAEGTEAADRFEADTVIKSKYKLNGESLEVDPD